MRKLISTIVCLACIFSVLPYCAAAAANTDKLTFEVIVPARYGSIGGTLSDNRFVTYDAGYQCLRDFDGNELLHADQIELYGDWIWARNKDDVMLYTHDVKPVLPSSYGALTLISLTQCVATRFEKRNISWDVYGQQDLYYLDTGEMQSLGKGWSNEIEGDPQYEIWSPQFRKDYPDGKGWLYTGETLEIGMTESGAKYAANHYGQMLIPEFWGELTFSNPFIIGNSGNSYIYTRRGRLIAIDPSSFYASFGGKYIKMGNSFINLSGEVVVPSDDLGAYFDFYPKYYNSGSQSGHAVVDRDGYWEFCEKDSSGIERHGILRIPEYTPQPDDWAKAEVGMADQLGLIDDDLRFWMKDSCTREEFCQILMKAIELHTGKAADELTKGIDAVDLYDAIDPSVIAAAKLKIVNGSGNGSCMPDKLITREEAATMLVRAAAYLGIAGSGQTMPFDDMNQVSPWAQSSVERISSIHCGEDAIPLMQGTRPGYFSPSSMYTVEQAAITLYRLLQA